MQALYRSQDISPSPIFVRPVSAPLLQEHSSLEHVAYMLGLAKDALWDNLHCEENTIELQPQMFEYLYHAKAYFLPSDNVCKRLLQVGGYNMASLPDERFVFSEVEELDSRRCVYTLQPRKFVCDRDILYARHPITGHVTAHTAPFPNLPSFILSASPWIVAIAASLIWRTGETSLFLIHLSEALLEASLPPYFGLAPPQPVALPLPSVDFKSWTTTPLLHGEIPAASPTRHAHGKRAHPYSTLTGESSHSSDDEPHPPKRNRRARKTKEHSMEHQNVAKAVCSTSHGPRTRAERRRVAY